MNSLKFCTPLHRHPDDYWFYIGNLSAAFSRHCDEIERNWGRSRPCLCGADTIAVGFDF